LALAGFPPNAASGSRRGGVPAFWVRLAVHLLFLEDRCRLFEAICFRMDLLPDVAILNPSFELAHSADRFSYVVQQTLSVLGILGASGDVQEFSGSCRF
jgi:hypothetical protein